MDGAERLAFRETRGPEARSNRARRGRGTRSGPVCDVQGKEQDVSTEVADGVESYRAAAPAGWDTTPRGSYRRIGSFRTRYTKSSTRINAPDSSSPVRSASAAPDAH